MLVASFALTRCLSCCRLLCNRSHLLIEHDLLEISVVVGWVEVFDTQYRLLLVVTAHTADVHRHFLNWTNLHVLRHGRLAAVGY